MNLRIPIHLVVEDSLSASVSRRILDETGKGYQIVSVLGGCGCGYIDSRLRNFNDAAKGMPHIVFRDLDTHECPPGLIAGLMSFHPHPNLIVRIVVREIEAWLLADRTGFSDYFRIPTSSIPYHVEQIDNPKEFLINRVRKYKKARFRDDIVPEPGSTAKQGRDYNGRLSEFVLHTWNITVAADRSPSLTRAVRALKNFTPNRTSIS